jgi:hypothetical protein
MATKCLNKAVLFKVIVPKGSADVWAQTNSHGYFSDAGNISLSSTPRTRGCPTVGYWERRRLAGMNEE